MALGFLFSGPMFPMVSAMNGAGDTKPPMITAFLANWPLKLPLSYILAVPMAHAGFMAKLQQMAEEAKKEQDRKGKGKR